MHTSSLLNYFRKVFLYLIIIFTVLSCKDHFNFIKSNEFLLLKKENDSLRGVINSFSSNYIFKDISFKTIKTHYNNTCKIGGDYKYDLYITAKLDSNYIEVVKSDNFDKETGDFIYNDTITPNADNSYTISNKLTKDMNTYSIKCTFKDLTGINKYNLLKSTVKAH